MFSCLFYFEKRKVYLSFLGILRKTETEDSKVQSILKQEKGKSAEEETVKGILKSDSESDRRDSDKEIKGILSKTSQKEQVTDRTGILKTEKERKQGTEEKPAGILLKGKAETAEDKVSHIKNEAVAKRRLKELRKDEK